MTEAIAAKELLNQKKFPGTFVSLEGIEGVGKSTQSARLRSYLEKQGKEVILTREPGGTPLAEAIRSVVLDREDEAINAEAELLLMFAARAVHLHNKIIPALERGAWVLCDRFTDATIAYQGYGRGQSLAFIQQLATTVQRGVWPDITILLDAPIELGLKRVASRGESNRFDAEKLDFFSRVQSGYLELAKQIPQRIKLIDASQSIDQVSTDIMEVLTELLTSD
ncbi:MAG: dTMP kinase [Gammaproteobacteria bacterium]|nr:dTMP kinase [Gammaproteobacteria bacterium]